MNGRALIAACAGACAISIPVYAVAAAHDDNPPDAPTPDWIQDGQFDIKRLPAWIGVAGPDGKPLLAPNGQPYVVPTDSYFVHGSPPVPDGMVAAPGFGPEWVSPPAAPPPAEPIIQPDYDTSVERTDEDVVGEVGGDILVLWEEIKKNEASMP